MAFARILRSSALMGGASVLVLVAAFFRTKAIALMVGPAGVGLAGILVSFNGLVAMAAGWGLATAGVRTVASATPDEQAAKIAAVRWLGVRLSWFGLLAVAIRPLRATAGLPLPPSRAFSHWSHPRYPRSDRRSSRLHVGGGT